MHSTDKKYECLIFDLDGTLLDSLAPIAEAVIASAKLNSLPVPSLEKAKEGIGKSFDLQYMGLFIDNYTEEQIKYSYSVKDKFRADFRAIYAKKELSLFAGVAELLKLLLSQNYELAIATNGARSMLNRVLKHFEITECFAVTCCGYEFAAKPSPEMLQHIMLETGHDNAIMIGDSPADIKAAENAGIDSILIENRDVFGGCSPSFIVKDIRDIINII